MLAAGVLLSSPYFLALGGIVTLDMGLTCWLTVAACAFLLAQASGDARERRRWMLGAWAAAALAVLSKGLVGLLFPAAAIALHALTQRDARLLSSLEWVRGVPVFLALAAPWFVLVARANPEFAHFFFVHEHFERFLTHEHRRVQPWWFFLPIVLLAFLPWAFALFAGLRHAWHTERRADVQPLRVALLTAAFIVLFFSASGSKLPAYILPAVPLLALPLARYLAEAPLTSLARYAALAVPVGLALLVAAYLVPGQAKEEWVKALNFAAQPFAYAAAAGFTAGALAAAWLARSGRRWTALAAVALANIVLVGGLIEAYGVFSPRQSDKEAAARVAPFVKPSTRLYSVKMYDQTVPFYIGRTVTLVDYTDEFETGLKSQPELRIPDVASFRAEWLRERGALAIMHPDTYQALRAQGLPMQLVHEDPRRVLVRKP